MLDDLKMIHERDTKDALGIIGKEWQQLTKVFAVALEPKPVSNIVYGGMGGSALGALMSQTWPGYDRPFEIVRGYDIPAYVSEETLFIAVSYSGNTEETLSAVDQAAAKGAQIVAITCGGALADTAREKQYSLVLLPSGLQPRYAVFYTFRALISVLAEAKLLTEDVAEVAAAADFLRDATAAWMPTVPTKNNLAKQIAQECIGRSVVIYGGPKLYPAVYKWKTGFNENAKQVAWAGAYSEFDHNEFLGWTKQPVRRPYAVIELRSNLEHERIQKRFALSDRLLSGMLPEPIVVGAEGGTILEQLLWTVALGDFATIYTALLSGIDPTPIDLMEKLKVELTK
ncbi:MAG TPA: bifunctional phosphoglucose/phosphomannose isomerase [Candidatus Saccharimonadales bacterium]